MTFDLTGLPPTPEEQAAFLADRSPDAYEKVVDRLLASPRYGERWAQHWLDVVRYAETDGFKEDALRPNAYNYRDYVIRAFNADLPYDRFIRQQLAGDELEPDNPEALVATGYCRLYPDEYNAANVRQRRQEILDDVTDTTGLAFLGLTIGCAHCHDHKFDPILQADYYRLQAFFAPMLPRDDLAGPTPSAARASLPSKQAAWEQATAEHSRRDRSARRPAAIKKARDEALEKFNAERGRGDEHAAGRSGRRFKSRSSIRRRSTPRPMEKAALGKLSKARQEALRRTASASWRSSIRSSRRRCRRRAASSTPVGRRRRRSASPAAACKHPAEEVEPGFPAFLGASGAGDRPAAGQSAKHGPPLGAGRLADAAATIR